MATDVPLVDAAQLLGELRRTFSSGRTKSEKWRSQQLRALLKMVTEQEKEICKALTLDLGKSEYETYACEVIILLRPGKEGGREGGRDWHRDRGRAVYVCLWGFLFFLSFFSLQFKSWRWILKAIVEVSEFAPRFHLQRGELRSSKKFMGMDTLQTSIMRGVLANKSSRKFLKKLKQLI